MAILPIVTGVQDKILRTESKPVKNIDKKIKKLIKDMTDTVIDVDGLGIAAPQVGVNLRIYIARLNHGTRHEMWVPMINPEFLQLGGKREKNEEGCLSIPNKFGDVERRTEVLMRYQDEKGKTHVLQLDSLNARIMQHEMDHLNGTLIADHWKKEPRDG
ncbi:peptide deformylase [Candidatus Peregrinibacteria bacterium CG11_big_fil_rev_8_21_14_0_20_46_8]|nr:MAG: peptide deformylase [Candidatus Peregrinibacteria bacterium CG11_big_fil_rev_8_21_14_0_20_46_8]